jgi:hypothetical protein
MKTVTSYQDPSATGAFDVREPDPVAHGAGEPLPAAEVFSALQDPSASAPGAPPRGEPAADASAPSGDVVLSLSAQDPALVLADTVQGKDL